MHGPMNVKYQVFFDWG